MDDLSLAAYYQSRERANARLRKRPPAPAVAEIHRDLARRYSELVEQSPRSRRESRSRHPDIRLSSNPFGDQRASLNDPTSGRPGWSSKGAGC